MSNSKILFDRVSRDKRIIEAAKKIKAANPSRSMKLCLLDAIIEDDKKKKIPDIFK